jgi:osmotically-inducible protein OsmY
MKTASLCLTLLVLFVLIPQTASAIEKETDLTNLFLAGGVDIDRLRVCEISGVVLIRGRTSDKALADHAVHVAALLGFSRVANLIEIVPGLADAAIDRFAVVGLRRAKELQGCTFEVETRRGIVYLLGEVDRDDQKDYAVRLVRRIDGVKEVRSGVTRSKKRSLT